VLLTLSSQGTNVHVATGGVALALVTTVNGDIRAGDRIAISPVSGVGMRSTTSGRVLGTAQADFSGTAAEAQEITVTTKAGSPQKAHVGRIPVLIDIGFYAAAPTQDTVVPDQLQRVVDQLVKKSVSPVRIIISIILIFLSLLIVTVLIYGAARNSIISIGRNPLSQPAIRRSLLQVIGMAAGILLVTLISVYLILSR
jgi:hypothetical protein